MTVQPGLCRTWSEPKLLVFSYTNSLLISALPPTPSTKQEVAPAQELGEDMLQMALRMASEMTDEPVMDLENSLEPVAVNTGTCMSIRIVLCDT